MRLEMQNKKLKSVNQRKKFFKDIRNKKRHRGLDDGSLRAIVAVSSTNFDLKSQDEQNSIIFNFQRFLNSLDFSIQIFNAKPKNGDWRLFGKVKTVGGKQTNELLRGANCRIHRIHWPVD